MYSICLGARQDCHGWNDRSQGSVQAVVRDSREDRQEQAAHVSSRESLQRKPAEPYRCGRGALLQPVGTWLQTRWDHPAKATEQTEPGMEWTHVLLISRGRYQQVTAAANNQSEQRHMQVGAVVGPFVRRTNMAASSQMKQKTVTKMCLWKHLRQKQAVTESWFIYDQHCLVL